MRTWYDVTKKDIEKELIPGVTTILQETINQLDWATYLNRIEDMIEMGINTDVTVVKDQIENVMVDTLIEMCRVTGRHGPEPDDIVRFLHDRNSILTKQNLTFLCVNSTKENWPEVKAKIMEALGLAL